MKRAGCLLDLSLRLYILRKSFIQNERMLAAKQDTQGEDPDLHFSAKELTRKFFQEVQKKSI